MTELAPQQPQAQPAAAPGVQASAATATAATTAPAPAVSRLEPIRRRNAWKWAIGAAAEAAFSAFFIIVLLMPWVGPRITEDGHVVLSTLTHIIVAVLAWTTYRTAFQFIMDRNLPSQFSDSKALDFLAKTYFHALSFVPAFMLFIMRIWPRELERTDWWETVESALVAGVFFTVSVDIINIWLWSRERKKESAAASPRR